MRTHANAFKRPPAGTRRRANQYSSPVLRVGPNAHLIPNAGWWIKKIRDEDYGIPHAAFKGSWLEGAHEPDAGRITHRRKSGSKTVHCKTPAPA